MAYLKEAFAELWRQDGLVVMARGLGVRRLLAKFLVMHCMHGDAQAPSLALEKEVSGKDTSSRERGDPSDEASGFFPEDRSWQRSAGDSDSNNAINNTDTSISKRRRTSTTGTTTSTTAAATTATLKKPRPLVLCLNTNGEETLFMDALMADGVPPDRLPEVVNAECTPVQRDGMYRSGGVFLVTSRVLIVDLLNKTVSPKRISGILVHNAHRAVDTSSEAFILRIYRESNVSGFVKGFTDEPESLLSGFGKLEKLMRNLGVAKVFLWPRFHSLVVESLERNPPKVEEMVQKLSGPTKEVQQAIVVLMDHTLRELRSSSPSLDSAELTVENCIFHSFDRSMERQLAPEWHLVGFKTRQLLQDLKTLRSLLDYVFQYDAINFYELLLDEKRKAAAVKEPPLWIGTPAAERLYVTAKARVYATVSSSNGARHPRPYPSDGKEKGKGKKEGFAVDKRKNTDPPPPPSSASSAGRRGFDGGDCGATSANAEQLEEEEEGRGGRRREGRREGRKGKGGGRGEGGGGGGQGGIKGDGGGRGGAVRD